MRRTIIDPLLLFFFFIFKLCDDLLKKRKEENRMVKKNYIVEAKVKGTLLLRQEADTPDEALDKTDEQELLMYPSNEVEHDIDIDLVSVEEENKKEE